MVFVAALMGGLVTFGISLLYTARTVEPGANFSMDIRQAGS
jgi:hypothetical protein